MCNEKNEMRGCPTIKWHFRPLNLNVYSQWNLQMCPWRRGVWICRRSLFSRNVADKCPQKSSEDGKYIFAFQIILAYSFIIFCGSKFQSFKLGALGLAWESKWKSRQSKLMRISFCTKLRFNSNCNYMFWKYVKPMCRLMDVGDVTNCTACSYQKCRGLCQPPRVQAKVFTWLSSWLMARSQSGIQQVFHIFSICFYIIWCHCLKAPHLVAWFDSFSVFVMIFPLI